MAAGGRLRASDAERWIECPGSVALAATVPPPPPRRASDDGTVCHAVLHRALTEGRLAPGESLEVRFDRDRTETVIPSAEMLDWAHEVADWVDEYAGRHPGAEVCSEVALPIGRNLGVPRPNLHVGYADVLIISPDEMLVLDAKFGYVRVDVTDNPQLLLYAMTAMDEYGWVPARVRIAIHQPRAGGPSAQVVETAALAEHRRRIRAAAFVALEPDAPRRAAGDGRGWCQFCPAAGVCPDLQANALAVAKREFAPDLAALPRGDLLVLLGAADQVRAALNAVEAHAKTLLEVGQDLPGWTLVYSEKHRAWTDEETAAAEIRLLGHDPYAPPKILTPAQAEKIVGKRAAKMLAPLIVRPRGEPVLARAGDPRDPVRPDFPALTEGGEHR